MYRSLTILGVGALLGLSACSGSGTNPKTPTQQNLGTNVLQFSVGTANLYGDLETGNMVGLNVAATYRQGLSGLTPGDSAVAVDSPSISGPFVLTVAQGSGGAGTAYSTLSTAAGQTGPSATEYNGSVITSTSQLAQNVTTFGTAGGVSGLGIEPFNFNTDNGVPYTYSPYWMPLYDSTSDTNGFAPLGWPPAFPSTGNSPAVAYSEGLDVFAGVTPVPGTYTLTVKVPVTPVFTQTANAGLNSTALLPAWVPQNPSLDGNDDGGASFPITLPAGVTEAYIQIIDYGPGGSSVSCNGSNSAPVSYTVFVNASGTATIAGNLGPGGKPTICDADLNTAANDNAPTPSDVFTVQLVGFDYPWYEASYPNSNGKPSPAISGANGQSDVTISSATAYQQIAECGESCGGKVTKLQGFKAKHTQSRNQLRRR